MVSTLLLLSLGLVTILAQSSSELPLADAVRSYQNKIDSVRQLINKTPGKPTKTKRYKCVPIEEDFPDAFMVLERPISSTIASSSYEMRKIGTIETPPIDSIPMPPVSPIDPIPVPPTAHRNVLLQQSPNRAPSGSLSSPSRSPSGPLSSPSRSPSGPSSSPNRSPSGSSSLRLSPEHCAQMKRYATLYRVKDVLGWVRNNCVFAKMYLPSASCEEINTLVASCY